MRLFMHQGSLWHDGVDDRHWSCCLVVVGFVAVGGFVAVVVRGGGCGFGG
jgi:hypothetical protein